jgi:3-hydroxy acid dehydrogenase / malonic semialdehyde reductase
VNRLEGRVAVVTGATSGIGEACAKRLAAAGAHLVLVGRRAERLRRLETALASAGVGWIRTAVLDVRHRRDVEAFAAGLEADGVEPDILVNNAGLARGLSRVHEGDPDDWDEMIDTNLRGLLYVSRALLPGMVRRDRGHVVNIGSVAGRWTYPMGNVYNATKYAVRALTEGMNMDLFGTGLRVSTVDPGMVRTEFSLVRFHGDEARAGTVYRGTRPLTPDDVADAVLYVLNAPAHVNVAEVVLWPTDQRSPTMVHRREES